MEKEMKLPKIGNMAPLFNLENQNGKKISLKEFRGEKNVILYFYPKAMTPGCNIQARGIRDSKRKFSAQKTIVFGVSPDELPRLIKFQEKEKINFDLLSDVGHTLADKYGVWGLKKFMGKEYQGIHRMTFIIGMDGKLKHIMEKVATKTHHEEALSWVKENLA